MADFNNTMAMKWASDPERWSKTSPGSPPDPEDLSLKLRAPPEPKKGSYTVPKMCGGGKVLKTWSK